MADEYRPPADRHEALAWFFQLTVSEAQNAYDHHTARARGGQHVGVARMSFGAAQDILRNARACYLGLEWDDQGREAITFAPPVPDNAPMLATTEPTQAGPSDG